MVESPQKRCFKCEAMKPLDEFYAHPRMKDGRLGKCKDCARKDVNANRQKRINYYREYDRRRGYRPGPKHKVAARAAVRNLQRQPCERCGADEHVQAHHEDYSKPLDVTWLCRTCHGQRHREINAERRQAAPLEAF